MLANARNLLCILLLSLVFEGLHGQSLKNDPDFGLQFSSHEVTKDHRTSLNLNPGAPFAFEHDFEVRFELSFQRLINAYGYVLRIIANDSVNIDLVSSPEHEAMRDLNLIINNAQTNLFFDFSDVQLQAAQWTPVVIGFSRSKKKISLSWAGKTKTQDFPVETLRAFRFYFGANDDGKFNTSDVPPMSLKNIALTANGETFAKWELKTHNESEVYDTQEGFVAKVKNPTWIIDKHTKWVHRRELRVTNYPSVTFNPKTNALYVVDKKQLYTLDIRNGAVVTTPFAQGLPLNTDVNQLVYIEELNKLVYYDIFTKKLLTYNFENQSWNNTDTVYLSPNYRHNNKFYNPVDQSLYMFGGYGHFTYKNDFFKYDFAANTWTKVETTDSIPPRYLGASGRMPSRNRVLIFGGYGSISGKQELSPQSFYDLYSFDLKSHHVKKIWSMESDRREEDIVFSNSLVVNEKDSCFYVLSYPKNKYKNQIKLRQYGLLQPEFRTLADSIPFQFHDEHSFCDLFLSEATKELIAVTVHKENDQFVANIYSIHYPPLSSEDVLQEVPGKNNAALTYLGILAGLGVLVVVYRIWKKKTKTESPAPAVINGATEHLPEVSLQTSLQDEKILSAVFLFGSFQVFDKTGNDITSKFTMTLKEMFTLILLHSVKFQKGISTTALQEYIWPDKDEVSARNNRNVNLKKLRTLLEEIGDISIENNNAYLHLLNNNVTCDYETVSRILDSGSTDIPDKQKIDVILKNVKRGSLLPHLQTAWLDNFKSDISNKIIDTLLEYSQKLDVNKDDKALLEIADAIFNYDSINQEALVIKCSVLNKKGKYSLAKTWYDHFAKEYKNLYSENYPKTFDEVIS